MSAAGFAAFPEYEGGDGACEVEDWDADCEADNEAQVR